MAAKSEKGPRLVAEFIVIVFGVLVALGVDALWDKRQELELEGFYLDQIALDLTATQADVGPALDRWGSSFAASSDLVNALNQEALPSADSLGTLLSATGDLPRIRIVAGTIDGLLDGGDLRLIRSPEIRNAILKYRDLIDVADATAQIQGPFLLETYRRIGESVRMHDVLGRVGERSASVDWEELADEPGFTSATFWLRTSLGNSLTAYRSVYEQSLVLSKAVRQAR